MKKTLIYRTGGRYCVETPSHAQLRRQYEIDEHTAKRWCAIQEEFEAMQAEVEEFLWQSRSNTSRTEVSNVSSD